MPVRPPDQPLPTGGGDAARSLRRPRAVFQLYLVGPDAGNESARGDYRLALAKASPGACARVLELLYVPIGRLGSETESYLLYEDADEFAAAGRFAPMLDAKAAAAPSNSASAFDNGVALLLHIIQSGAIVDPTVVAEAERQFSLTLNDDNTPALQRWAGGILGGRVASEYRYDDSAARVFFLQAEKLVHRTSIERMTARWWIADSLVQEGDPDAARAIYFAIEREFAERPNAQIVRRSRAWLKRKR